MRREIEYDEVYEAQQHFRIILDCMARPGKLNTMPDMNIEPPVGLNKASALVALALLNADVCFYAAEGEEITEYLALNTNAARESVSTADFLFINGNHDASIAFEAKTGTLSYPEDSATFVIDVEEIIDIASPGGICISLKGPGIETERQVSIKGLNPSLLENIKEQNTEFPLGIDLMLTDKNNRILCIPRSNQFVITGRTESIEIQ